MKLGGFPERIWRGRWSRPVLLVGLFLLLATVTWPGPPPPPPGPGVAQISMMPVALDDGDPARREVGRLRFLGGWSLASDDVRFGGISAMHVEAGMVTAISDIGLVLTFPVPGAARAARVRIDPLFDGPGPRTRRSNRDTEGLAVDGGRLWVSFEKHNMIWRYDRVTLRAQSAAQPAPMRRWPGNSGAEALVRLADGRFLVIAEGRDQSDPDSDAVLFAGDAAAPGTPALRLRYRRPAGYRATDAALLPDGRVLILNRGFSWLRFSARLVVADVRGLAAGATIEGREIAALAAPVNVDNMEALAVTREGGRTIVWIASDDNFSPLQRTLLLKFELVE
jgi:hypothetical protein